MFFFYIVLHYFQVITSFQVQFDVISTCKSVFQRLQIALAQQAHAILLSLKNVLMAINTKLH